jgi:Leucine-rich repeat (LRR) protein
MLNFEKHHTGLKVLSSKLKKLENLDLSDNQCNDSIFSSLTGFSSLKSLDLSYNEVTGSGSFYGDRLII